MELESIENRLRRSLKLTAAIALLGIASYFIWFGVVHRNPLSADTGTWGEFGDFIGGLMNPIVAGCALYWLAMSVRLQKQELAATREELELTRGELATASAAQQEQARLAMLSTQISSLNLRLSAITSELTHLRARLNYALQYMDTKGALQSVYDIENGGSIKASHLAHMLEEKIVVLAKNEKTILIELEMINTLILAKQI